MSIGPVVEQVAHAIRGREDELVARMLVRFAAEVPGLADMDPDLAAAVRVGAHGILRAGVDTMLAGAPVVDAPQDVLDDARLAAQAGIPLGPSLQTYRIGQSVVFDAVLDVVDTMPDLDASVRSAALRVCTQSAFAYVDAVIPFFIDEYTRERDRMVRGREAHRVQLVRDILDGQDADPAALGYDLTATHRAAVAWGPGADAELTRLAHEAGARLLLVPATGQTVWGWLAGGRTPSPDAGWGGRLAFGRLAEGVDGFRLTHREARAAHRIGMLIGAPCTFFDDVVLESFLLADEQAARAFVRAEIGALDRTDGPKLRATLTAYFATGFNASSAAAQLGVTDRTVANRLATIEQLIGRSLRARQTELQAALRLERILAPAVEYRHSPARNEIGSRDR